jgi:carbamoyl-phosphate synthase large subunit
VRNKRGMNEINILFCAAGRRVSLIRHFRQVLADLSLSGRILAGDASFRAPASFVADERVLLPRIDHPDYISLLLGICREHRVKLLISLIDTDLILLSQNVERFSEIGVRLLVSSEATNFICADKRNTYDFFRRNNIPTAKIYSPDEITGLTQDDFPIMIKPADGSSGVGVTRIDSQEQLEFFSDYIKNSLVQEFVSGQEFTVDVYVDFEGAIRCVVPRRRIEVRAGEVSKAITVKDEALITEARRVVESLPHAVGCITVQVFREVDGQLKFIEINPRFGGGFPLSIRAGADFPRWIVQELCGMESTATMSDWQDNLAMLRYDDEIFVTGDMISEEMPGI